MVISFTNIVTHDKQGILYIDGWRASFIIHYQIRKVDILIIDGLHLFWFSRKIALRTYLAGKTKINWKESTWKVVNRINWFPTSLYTSFVSVNFGKNMPDSCGAFGCTNWRSSTSLQFYRIPSAKRYPERRIKWVSAMRREKWPAEKINNARMCSAHLATGKPS